MRRTALTYGMESKSNAIFVTGNWFLDSFLKIFRMAIKAVFPVFLDISKHIYI